MNVSKVKEDQEDLLNVESSNNVKAFATTTTRCFIKFRCENSRRDIIQRMCRVETYCRFLISSLTPFRVYSLS